MHGYPFGRDDEDSVRSMPYLGVSINQPDPHCLNDLITHVTALQNLSSFLDF